MSAANRDAGPHSVPSDSTCAFCGEPLPPAARFCPQCGQAVAKPTGPDEATSFAAADEDRTRFAGPDERGGQLDAGDDSLTIAAPSDHALTIAAVSDSLADALTVATPITPIQTPPSPSRPHRRARESGPLEVGQSFGPRYHIIRLLGAGGMGAVYQAWDAELGVAVAIKVIRPEVMADPVMAEEVFGPLGLAAQRQGTRNHVLSGSVRVRRQDGRRG